MLPWLRPIALAQRIPAARASPRGLLARALTISSIVCRRAGRTALFPPVRAPRRLRWLVIPDRAQLGSPTQAQRRVWHRNVIRAELARLRGDIRFALEPSSSIRTPEP